MATKPVKLQMNTTGAWRNVVSFDAAKDVECGEVLDAAERLARIGHGTARVVINDGSPSPEVLMHWGPTTGWKEARRA